GIQSAFVLLLDIAQWYLLPIVFLPWIAMLCGAPFSQESAKRAARTYKRFGYWLGIFIALMVGVYVPIKFIAWRWGTSLESEMVSMIVRLGLAYLFFIAGWLFALAVTAVASLPEMDEPAPVPVVIPVGAPNLSTRAAGESSA